MFNRGVNIWDPFLLQVIQIVSAVDKDDPKNGHYFLYSLLPEMVNNPNFTIKKNEGKYKVYVLCTWINLVEIALLTSSYFSSLSLGQLKYR